MNEGVVHLHRVFVYGSLRRGGHNHQLLQRDHARFLGHTLTRQTYEMFDVGFPLITPAPASALFSAPVAGEVYLVTDQGLQQLDELEGEGIMYRRERVDLRDSEPAFAYIWIKAPMGEPVPPTPDGFIDWMDIPYMDKKISRRPVREAGEFDYGHTDQSKTHSFHSMEYTGKGKADLKNRRTAARYADNPLTNQTEGEPAEIMEDSHETILDRLHRMLSKADVSDEEIRLGINLTDSGLQKVAAKLGCSPTDVPMLIDSLATRLDADEKNLEEAYGQFVVEADRFSYEPDFLNNVTIRDSKTGRSCYLSGSNATKLLADLRTDPSDEQRILSNFQNLMEADGEVAADTYDDEIHAKSGSFNMPWRFAGRHGNMTVFYSTKGDRPMLEIESVRDPRGVEITPDSKLHAALMVQAHDFIGHE